MLNWLKRSLGDTTGGALELTSYPLSLAWGFTTGDDQIPDQEAIDSLLPLVDDSAITLDGTSAYAGVVSATDLSIDTSGSVVFLFYVLPAFSFRNALRGPHLSLHDERWGRKACLVVASSTSFVLPFGAKAQSFRCSSSPHQTHLRWALAGPLLAAP